MPNLRRYYIPNSIVFITGVTRNRIKYFNDRADVTLFWSTLKSVQEIHPFHLLAYTILPDHFHWLLKMPEGNPNFSIIIHSIKRNFTRNYKKSHNISHPFSIWQNRFWDHIIRDDVDLQRHFDYIHWNPVKHGYVTRPEDWEDSTYRFWFEKGYYPENWKFPDSIADVSDMHFE